MSVMLGLLYRGGIVICNGMPRSASTWSYNAALNLSRAVFGQEAVIGGYDEDVSSFMRSIPRAAKQVILKCHTLDESGRKMARSGRARVIYTERDPADAIVSAMTMWGLDFEAAFESVRWSLKLRDFHRATRRALILDYELIMSHPVEATQMVANYLGFGVDTLTPESVRAVADEVGIERMRARVDALTDADVEQAGDAAHDPETLFHRGHIQDARTGKGRELLSREQLTQIDRLLLRAAGS